MYASPAATRQTSQIQIDSGQVEVLSKLPTAVRWEMVCVRV